jgi:hypothetical protein
MVPDRLTTMKPPVRYLRVFLLLLFSSVGVWLVAFGRSALLEAFSGAVSDTPAMLGRTFVCLVGLGSLALGVVALVLTATAAYVTRHPPLEGDQEGKHPEDSNPPDHRP